MIRGHKHLKQCAYIGDNSSEELDELDEAEEGEGNNTSDEPSNKPHEMKKIMEGVVVHTVGNNTMYSKFGSSDVSGRQISASEKHKLGKTWKLDKKAAHVHLTYADQIINPQPKHKTESDYYKLHHETVNIPVSKEHKVQSSKEFYEQLLKKLDEMGPKGKNILEKLNIDLDQKEEQGLNKNETKNPITTSFPPSQNLTNNDTLQNNHPKQNLALKIKGRKREISLGGQLHSELTRHDENEDHAMEEVKLNCLF